jgi:hypothetical protein
MELVPSTDEEIDELESKVGSATKHRSCRPIVFGPHDRHNSVFPRTAEQFSGDAIQSRDFGAADDPNSLLDCHSMGL